MGHIYLVQECESSNQLWMQSERMKSCITQLYWHSVNSHHYICTQVTYIWAASCRLSPLSWMCYDKSVGVWSRSHKKHTFFSKPNGKNYIPFRVNLSLYLTKRKANQLKMVHLVADVVRIEIIQVINRNVLLQGKVHDRFVITFSEIR